MLIPQDYVVAKFYELGYSPKHNKYNNTYQCGCPVCREGHSLGRKRRCYYIPEKDNIFCHNCGWSSKPAKWICEVSKMTLSELYESVKSYVPSVSGVSIEPKKVNTETLPEDSISLYDKTQLDYYKNNRVLHVCLSLLNDRKLSNAVNKPTNLYLSLKDNTHKNRLIIPFYNENGDIEFYQSRSLDPKDKKRYLSKINADKTLFNIDKIDTSKEFVYIFEGPLDAFFVKNSVATAGVTEGKQLFTTRQQEQVDTVLKFQTRIWVLDSQWIDKASLKKTRVLLDKNEKVFIWPERIGKLFKDFNDVAIAGNKSEISEEFIQKNTYEGLAGILKLSELIRSKTN